MFGLVFRKGFAGLSLACLTFAVAPALALEPPEGTPPPQAGGPHDAPPAAEDEGSPQSEEPPPPASEPETGAPEERERVQIRSVEQPQPAPEEPPADDAPAADSTPPERGDSPRRTESRAPAAGTFRRAVTSTPAAPVAATAAAVPAAPADPSSPREEGRRSEPVAPKRPLPARVVPQPVRRIVEVVPTGIWIAVAALGLLALLSAAWSFAAAARARRLRRQREALLQEVGLLQSALLPSVSRDVPASVAYRPADGDAAGGDFYDVFALAGGRTGVILGEMSGRGRDALAHTTFVRYTLRAYLEAGLEPREVLKVGADALAGHLDGGFAAVTVAVHDPATGRFTYATAGHPPPVVVGCDEEFEPVTACSAPPLGLGLPTGFRQSTITLTAGARACMYTDGVTEARADGRVLGVAQLERTLAALLPEADADALLDAIAAAADESADDMAVCLIDAGEDSPEAGPRIEELEVDEYEVGDSLERFLRACGVGLGDVPGILREAGEAARREGSATVRVRAGGFRPGVDVVPGNLVRLEERQPAVR